MNSEPPKEKWLYCVRHNWVPDREDHLCLLCDITGQIDKDK